MAQNIMLIGGTSMIPGFQSRLHDHMRHLLDEDKQYDTIKRLGGKLKFIKTVFMPNCAAWIGGK
jgi:actin-related protein 10